MAMSIFNVLSHIPDNYQAVTEMVFDRLPKPSKVDIVIDIVFVDIFDLI